MAGDLLQLLANPSNRAILGTLAVEPQYTRRLAELAGLTEEEASRRLRAFEKAGLVKGEWAQVAGRKTVKLYRLTNDRLTVRLGREGVEVEIESAPAPTRLSILEEAPPRAERFVGRQEEARALADLLDRRAAACIHGIGGVGKTTLAAALARDRKGTLIWITTPPAASAPLLVSTIARGLRAAGSDRGLGASTSEDPALVLEAVARAMDASAALVVLDRFESATDEAGDAASSLATRLRRGRLLMTSRVYPTSFRRDAVASFPLGGLTREGTAELAAMLLGKEVEADEVYRHTGGHPMSVVLLAAAARPDRAASVATLLEASGIREFFVTDVLPQLTDLERETLLATSTFRLPFTAEEAEALLPGSKHTRDALARLAFRGFLTRVGERFSLHDIVRDAATGLTPDAKVVHARAAKALAASGEPPRVAEALHHWIEGRKPAEAASVVEAEARERRYRFADLGLAARYRGALEALSKDAALGGRERDFVHVELAGLNVLEGRVEEARTELARSDARHLDPKTRTRRRMVEAALAKNSGKGEQAIQDFEDAVALAKATGDATLLSEATLGLAGIVEEIDWARAYQLYMEAATIAEQSQELRLLALAYAGASRFGIRLEPARGEDLAREALRISRLAGYPRGEAMAHTSLVEHYWVRGTPGDLEEARAHAEEHLRIARALGDPWEISCALCDVAITAARRGDGEEAVRLGREASEGAERVKSTFLGAGAAWALGEGLLLQGHADEAIAVVEGGLRTHSAASNEKLPPVFSGAWRTLERAYAAKGDAARSRDARAAADALDERGRTVGWFAP